MGTVIVHVSVEQRWREQQHHRGGLAKSRELGEKTHVRLIGRIRGYGDIRALDPKQPFHLGRHAFVPGESLADDDRLAGKHKGGTIEIDRGRCLAYAVPRRVERILDEASLLEM